MSTRRRMPLVFMALAINVGRRPFNALKVPGPRPLSVPFLILTSQPSRLGYQDLQKGNEKMKDLVKA